MSRRHPTDEDRRTAVRSLLSGLARGHDAVEIARDAIDLHPKNDTFPGEVFLQVAADALDLAAATNQAPIPFERVVGSHLPECEFRGRERSKLQFAILASAASRGGIDADLLDEVMWWQTDDFWRYALYASVAIIRAGAEHRGVSVHDFVIELAERSATTID